MNKKRLKQDLFKFDYDSFIDAIDEDLKYDFSSKVDIETQIDLLITRAKKQSIRKFLKKGSVFREEIFNEGTQKVWCLEDPNHPYNEEEFGEDIEKYLE